MSEIDRKIEFWGREEDEHLTHTEMDPAIEEILDGMDNINALPETIEVCGYAHTEPSSKGINEHVLEHLLEWLDEEYGDSDKYSDPTDGMKEAADTFVAAVLAEYTVWACDLVKKETVNVQEWIKENRPDWLEEKP